MARFKIEKLKSGYADATVLEYLTITAIEFEEGDDVIVLPNRFEGELITHLGFVQDFEPAHEEWCDWHHPGKGVDYVSDRYTLKSVTVEFPKGVKKVVLSQGIKSIAYHMRDALDTVYVEVVEGNCHYGAENGKLFWKR